jgi:hypothetical protein
MHLLDQIRKDLKTPTLEVRANTSFNYHATTKAKNGLEQTMLPILDAALQIPDVSTDKEVFQDFMELRDLERDLFSAFERTIEANKHLVEILDKILFWIDKKL